jgi:hypothetical protein
MATQWTAGLTSGSTLPAATLNTIGAAWESWTPTFVNITVGNGVLVARYSRINKNVTVQLRFTLGSTSVIGGGGGITMSLPVTMATAQYSNSASLIGIASMVDVSPFTNYPAWVLVSSSTAVAFGYMTSFRYQEMFGTGPFTWTTNDVFTCSFTYEAA